MKRYLLFVCHNYYPDGGWDDFVGDFDSIVHAMDAWGERGGDRYHIVDTRIKRIVKFGHR